MNKQILLNHFYSFLHTLITEILWDAAIGAVAGHILLNGDFSKTALSGLGYAVFRTFCRVLRDELKKLFPKNNEVTTEN